MQITWRSSGAVLGTLLAAVGIIAAVYNTTVWIDEIYIDKDEIQAIIDKQNSILQIMNNNIVNIGTAIYDRKLEEIDRWIKELKEREDKNAVEIAFLENLQKQRTEVELKKENLNKIGVSF